MNKNSDISSLLKVEEGVRHKPYIDA
ncbi:TPA_asm: lysozyme, partial [Salmonella enterica subsp. arizonae]|nr:lysozyme [Salmonella enterica subsp. arizonae]